MNDEKRIEDTINQSLDASVDDLSPEIRRRLNQVRIEALEQKSFGFSLWKTAGAVSFAVMLGLTFQLIPQHEETQVDSLASVLQSEVLEEDLEMLEELEFVYWMAEESDSAIL